MSKLNINDLADKLLARLTSSEAPAPAGPKGRVQSKASTVSAVKSLDFRWTPKEQDLEVVKAYVSQLQRYFGVRASYIFQLEKGEETGKLHFQCSIRPKFKIRPDTFRNDFCKEFKGAEHTSIHCAAAHDQRSIEEYCAKPGRIDGPWSDSVIYQGKDLPKYDDLYPYQKNIVDEIQQDPQERVLNWLYDPVGGTGKTKLVKYLAYHHKVPPLTYGTAKNILQIVFDLPTSKAYCFNLTRAKPKDLGAQDLYAVLEQIKDGLVVSTMYKGGTKIFDPPHVWIFANHKPSMKHMSKDRWKIWTVEKNKLVEFRDFENLDDYSYD